MMNFNIIDIILIITFISPLLVAYFRQFNIYKIQINLLEIGKYIALFVSVYSSFYIIINFSLVEKAISLLLTKSSHLLEEYKSIPYYIIIVIFIVSSILIYNILSIILKILNRVLLTPLLHLINRYQIRRGKLFGKIISLILTIPKATFYTFLLWIGIGILGRSGFLDKEICYYVEKSKTYYLFDKSSFASIINEDIKFNSLLEESIPTHRQKVESNKAKNKENIVYLYNGVTLEEGIKSNEKINNKAHEIVAGSSNSKDKAKKLYKWIGSNIVYDDEKAKSINNKNDHYESGAIEAFESRKGVCFDYACLYIAMAKAVGLEVRLLTGDAFNGVSWGPHAWNEVYLNEENRWISVDPTFYKAGNYFDNKKFDKTHKSNDIIGSW